MKRQYPPTPTPSSRDRVGVWLDRIRVFPGMTGRQSRDYRNINNENLSHRKCCPLVSYVDHIIHKFVSWVDFFFFFKKNQLLISCSCYQLSFHSLSFSWSFYNFFFEKLYNELILNYLWNEIFLNITEIIVSFNLFLILKENKNF